MPAISQAALYIAQDLQHHQPRLHELLRLRPSDDERRPYGRWSGMIHFYALRLHEAKMIGPSPQKILIEGIDWRFLNDVKNELKGVTRKST